MKKLSKKIFAMMTIFILVLSMTPFTVLAGTTSYTVVYFDDDCLYYSDSVDSGSTLTAPPEPTKDGYTFTGWYEDGSDTAWDFENDTVTSYTELYAGWTEATTSYTVTFDTNGGTSIDAISVDSGTALDTSTYTTTYSGYYFAGWYTDADCTTEFTSGTEITADTTLYAGWGELSSCLVYVDAYLINSDGTADSTETETYYTSTGDTISDYLDGSVTYDGYTFQGYYATVSTDDSTSVVSFSDALDTSDIFTEDSTYYAYYTADASSSHTVTLVDSDSGDTLYTIDVNDGDTLSQTVLNAYYNTGSWYIDESCTTEYDYTSTISSDLTLYSTPSTNYTMTFVDSMNETSTDVESDSDGYITAVDDPTYDGYTFTGWYTDEDCTVEADLDSAITADTTVYAGWEEESTSCTVTLIEADAGGTTSFTVNSGDTLSETVLDAYITLDNYTIDNWYTDEDCSTSYDFNTTITSDTTLYCTGKVKVRFQQVYFSSTGSSGSGNYIYVSYGSTLEDYGLTSSYDDYSLVGYYTDYTLSTEISADTPITTAITNVYAYYLYDYCEISYYLSEDDYDNDDAYIVNTESTGSVATEPDAPTKDGYTFTGWYTDADCTSLYDFSTALTFDVDLYAGWEEDTTTDSDYSIISEDGTAIVAGFIDTKSDSDVIFSYSLISDGVDEDGLTVDDVLEDNGLEISDYVAYDMDLTQDGITVEPTDEGLEVTIPMPEGLEDADSITVYVINDDGSVTELECTINGDGTITFIAPHFSTYIFADSSDVTTVSTSDSDTATSTDNSDSSDSSDTATTDSVKTGDLGGFVVISSLLAIASCGVLLTVIYKKNLISVKSDKEYK